MRSQNLVIEKLQVAINKALSSFIFERIDHDQTSAFDEPRGARKILFCEHLHKEGLPSYEFDHATLLRDIADNLSPKVVNIDAYGSCLFNITVNNESYRASILNTYGDEDNLDTPNSLLGLAFIVDSHIYLVDIEREPSDGNLTFTAWISAEALEAELGCYSGKRAFYHYRGLGVSVRYNQPLQGSEDLFPPHRTHVAASEWSSSPRHFFQVKELKLKAVE